MRALIGRDAKDDLCFLVSSEYLDHINIDPSIFLGGVLHMTSEIRATETGALKGQEGVRHAMIPTNHTALESLPRGTQSGAGAPEAISIAPDLLLDTGQENMGGK
eukprot:1689487-Amphidinium_carterae.1